MMRIVKAALIGGIVLHLWVSFSWMVLPWHGTTIHDLKEPQAVQLALLQNISDKQPKVYALPGFHDKKNQEGPAAFIALTPMGQKFSFLKLARDAAFNGIAAALVTWMLIQTSITCFWRKTLFYTCFGFTAGFMTYMADWNWWGFASDYVAVGIADATIGWFITGMVLAKFNK